MAEIIVNLKGKELLRQKVEKSPFSLGSHPSNDLHLDNPAVSSEHAKIVFRQFQYHLSDVGSTNGTFCNGQRLTEELCLQPNMTFVVGKFSIEVIKLDEPPREMAQLTNLNIGGMGDSNFHNTIQLSNRDLQNVMRAAMHPDTETATPRAPDKIETSDFLQPTPSMMDDLKGKLQDVSHLRTVFMAVGVLLLCGLAFWLGKCTS